MGEWFGCSGKRKDWRHTFYFVWNDLKTNGVLVVGEGGRFLVLFLAATRWKTLQTNMKECVVLFHTEFFPPKFFFFLYIFHQRDGDLGTGPISWLLCKCDRASCERKRIFPPAVGVGVGVCCHHICSSVVDWMSFRCHVSAVDCPTRWVNSLFIVFSSTVYLNSICCRVSFS